MLNMEQWAVYTKWWFKQIIKKHWKNEGKIIKIKKIGAKVGNVWQWQK